MSSSAQAPENGGEFVQWLQAARQGDREALGRVLEPCRAYLLVIANENLNGAVRAKEGASDLVQDTFLEAKRDLGAFRGTTVKELHRWLRRILVRNLANLYRRYLGTGMRDCGLDMPIADPALGELARQLAALDDTPQSAAITQETLDALYLALTQLPEKARQMIEWHTFKRQTFEQIAQQRNLSADAARQRWVRAVKELAQRLEKFADDSG